MAKSDNLEREERILDATERLLIHYGYDKTTVSDIAREASVSKGAIYLHFESKDDLVDALLLRELRRYSESWFRLIEADPRGGTMGGMYKNVLYALKDNQFMLAIFKQDSRIFGNYIRKPSGIFQKENIGLTRHDFVLMMQEAGAVRKDIDAKVYAHIMNMLSYSLVMIDQYVDPATIPPLDEVIEAIGFMMDKALTPDDGGDSAAGKAVIEQFMETARQFFENQR